MTYLEDLFPDSPSHPFTRISEIGPHPSITHKLARLGIVTVGALRAFSERELTAIQGIDQRAIDEIKSLLQLYFNPVFPPKPWHDGAVDTSTTQLTTFELFGLEADTRGVTLTVREADKPRAPLSFWARSYVEAHVTLALAKLGIGTADQLLMRCDAHPDIRDPLLAIVRATVLRYDSSRRAKSDPLTDMFDRQDHSWPYPLWPQSL